MSKYIYVQYFDTILRALAVSTKWDNLFCLLYLDTVYIFYQCLYFDAYSIGRKGLTFVNLVQKEPMHILRVAASSTGWFDSPGVPEDRGHKNEFCNIQMPNIVMDGGGSNAVRTVYM